MNDKIYLVGGGGHCRACIDVIEATETYRIAGIVDQVQNLGNSIQGIEINATDSEFSELINDRTNFHVTVGFIGSPALRCRIYDELKHLAACLPPIVSPRAYVSQYARVQAGTIVMHGALINASAVVGENCIINTNALIEHDAVIGDHCHVSTGAVINGGCVVSSRVFVGSNSVLAQGVTLGDDVIVGAGSVVLNDLPEPGVYAGNPCRKIH